MVFHAGTKNIGGLLENTGNLMKSCNIILVVLDGVEGDGKREVREVGMDTIHLINGHLILFEVKIRVALL